MNKYELWLDESGSFEKEEQENIMRHPSLVGGVLIPQGLFTDRELTDLVGQSLLQHRSHGTSMSQQERHTVLVPALQKIVQKGGVLVYFENSDRVSYYDNRELYLRLMAGGLIQLFTYLGNRGGFLVDIILAKRMVRTIDDRSLIGDDEYLSLLRSYMIDGWNDGTFDVENDCRINISVQDARFERKLQLADYACNSRLTCESGRFFESDKQILKGLFEKALIFGIKTQLTESRIVAHLASRDIPRALIEFYTTRENIDRNRIASLIKDKFSGISFYHLRGMIDEFTGALLQKVYRESDFERSEGMLKEILRGLFSMIHEVSPEIQTDVSRFRILLCLSDMYLREGDISHAGAVLEEMYECVHSMNYHVESLKWLYYYNDKLALYHILRMEYADAVQVIERSISVLESISSLIDIDENLNGFFKNRTPKSEFLGNAYTMKIYAEMFLQRSDPDLYRKSLRNDSEKALEQYYYSGELERNQQYRAHIEMVEGNCKEALKWFLATKSISLKEDDSILPACVELLTMVSNENDLSKEYYLMYYVEIMLESHRIGESSLADLMHSALISQQKVYEELLNEDAIQSKIRSDHNNNTQVYNDFLWNEFRPPRRHYHPREITLWKYGCYLFKSSVGRTKAFSYYDKAISICFKEVDYEWMHIIGLAISAERVAIAIEGDIKVEDQKRFTKDLLTRINILKKRNDLAPEMEKLLIMADEAMTDYKRKMNDSPEQFCQDLFKIADRIAY